MSVNNELLVSVITPAHNAQKFLSDSAQSVLAQSYGNVELIICDDGSTDSTWDIATQLSESDSRVKVIRHAHARGAGAARNSCMDAASGHYIAFLDADDIWTKDKIEQQLKYALEQDADFVFSHYRTFKDSGIDDNTSRIIDSHWAGAFLYKNLLWKMANLGCLTVLCKASLIGDRRMSDIRSGQDYAFWLELLRTTNKAFCFPAVTAHYRIGHSSLSGNKIKKIKNFFAVFKYQEKYSTPYCVLLCINYSAMTVLLALRSKLLTKQQGS